MKKAETKLLEELPEPDCFIICNTCSRETRHKVFAHVRQTASHYTDDYNSVDLYSESQIIMCLGCEEVSFRQTKANNQDVDYDPVEGAIYIQTEDRYPQIESAQLFNDFTWDQLKHIPQKIQLIYKETCEAFQAGQHVLAGVGIRAITETLCTDQGTKKDNLKNRITELVTQQKLTISDAAILDSIREIGNRSAHEITPPSSNQLKVALEVIYHQTLSVYVHPKLTTILDTQAK
jgi:hypothetical protein